jgi:hypothetical protein
MKTLRSRSPYLNFSLFRGFDTYSGLYVGDDTEETDDGERAGRRQAKRMSSFHRARQSDSTKARQQPAQPASPIAEVRSKKKRRENRRQTKRSRKNRRKTKNPGSGEDKYESMLYANKAAEIIRSQADGSPPFFIYLSFLTKSYPRDNKVSSIPSTLLFLASAVGVKTQKIRQNESVSGDSLLKAAKSLLQQLSVVTVYRFKKCFQRWTSRESGPWLA